MVPFGGAVEKFYGYKNFEIKTENYARICIQSGPLTMPLMVRIIPYYFRRHEVFMAMKPLQSEDGGNKDLRNVGIPPHHYTASQPTRPLFELLLGCLTLCDRIQKIHSNEHNNHDLRAWSLER